MASISGFQVVRESVMFLQLAHLRVFQIFFPLQTLLFTVFLMTALNIRTCEHMVLGQLRMGARQAKNAPLLTTKVPAVLIKGGVVTVFL